MKNEEFFRAFASASFFICLLHLLCSRLEILQVLQADFHRQPNPMTSDSTTKAPMQAMAQSVLPWKPPPPMTSSGERGDDIDGTQHETQRAARSR